MNSTESFAQAIAHARMIDRASITSGRRYTEEEWAHLQGPAERLVRMQLLRDKRRPHGRTIKAEGRCTFGEWIDLCAFYNNRCLRCGWQGTPATLSADHVIPLSKGGRDDTSNIQVLCSSCNSTKRTHFYDYRPHNI